MKTVKFNATAASNTRGNIMSIVDRYYKFCMDRHGRINQRCLEGRNYRRHDPIRKMLANHIKAARKEMMDECKRLFGC